MKLVADTNILFTFFWEGSFTKGLLADQDFDFFAPEYALEEINRHSSEIMEKTNISSEKFKEFRTDIAIFVEFIPVEEYRQLLPRALSLMPTNPNDIDFLALALKLNLPIWSNDPGLKKQSKVKVYTTPELLKEIGASKR
ncbi:hypothetical protein HYU10_01370 [Candidatus Woesearchaeota archaeon]|nr:hypothetical protein [Candidatus Woesearchaeota archaeon]MBI2130397.1 hypothetical protein [Candidatus Woesearchaeota archaeon]